MMVRFCVSEGRVVVRWLWASIWLRRRAELAWQGGGGVQWDRRGCVRTRLRTLRGQGLCLSAVDSRAGGTMLGRVWASAGGIRGGMWLSGSVGVGEEGDECEDGVSVRCGVVGVCGWAVWAEVGRGVSVSGMWVSAELPYDQRWSRDLGAGCSRESFLRVVHASGCDWGIVSGLGTVMLVRIMKVGQGFKGEWSWRGELYGGAAVCGMALCGVGAGVRDVGLVWESRVGSGRVVVGVGGGGVWLGGGWGGGGFPSGVGLSVCWLGVVCARRVISCDWGGYQGVREILVGRGGGVIDLVGAFVRARSCEGVWRGSEFGSLLGGRGIDLGDRGSVAGWGSGRGVEARRDTVGVVDYCCTGCEWARAWWSRGECFEVSWCGRVGYCGGDEVVYEIGGYSGLRTRRVFGGRWGEGGGGDGGEEGCDWLCIELVSGVGGWCRREVGGGDEEGGVWARGLGLEGGYMRGGQGRKVVRGGGWKGVCGGRRGVREGSDESGCGDCVGVVRIGRVRRSGRGAADVETESVGLRNRVTRRYLMLVWVGGDGVVVAGLGWGMFRDSFGGLGGVWWMDVDTGSGTGVVLRALRAGGGLERKASEWRLCGGGSGSSLWVHVKIEGGLIRMGESADGCVDDWCRGSESMRGVIESGEAGGIGCTAGGGGGIRVEVGGVTGDGSGGNRGAAGEVVVRISWGVGEGVAADTLSWSYAVGFCIGKCGARCRGVLGSESGLRIVLVYSAAAQGQRGVLNSMGGGRELRVLGGGCRHALSVCVVAGGDAVGERQDDGSN
ncbi:hypothetical protein Tco_0638488 [Tanacetum coccineum]